MPLKRRPSMSAACLGVYSMPASWSRLCCSAHSCFHFRKNFVMSLTSNSKKRGSNAANNATVTRNNSFHPCQCHTHHTTCRRPYVIVTRSRRTGRTSAKNSSHTRASVAKGSVMDMSGSNH